MCSLDVGSLRTGTEVVSRGTPGSEPSDCLLDMVLRTDYSGSSYALLPHGPTESTNLGKRDRRRSK